MSLASQTEKSESLRPLLRSLYGEDPGTRAEKELRELLATQPSFSNGPNRGLTEHDVLLITYADQVQKEGEPPLRTLARFYSKHLSGLISGVHILPFYPWSSDDGFSVKDYYRVAPEYGTWDDITLIHQQFDLMFDAVFNHMSAESDWFRRFVEDIPEFREFFVTVENSPDLSSVVRPRALPLLTEFPTRRGIEKVWTTFSADQVDLNVANPRVLLALVEVLLFYVKQGARFIRLDAIAYLWKEMSTPCIHLPQTHAVIQLLRAVLDLAAPEVQLITETNVPHSDNISYFGNGSNEAQMVYNFALPPLVLHALLKGDASYLTHWANGLSTPSPKTTFFNFLASHDGIGLNPARGILPQEEIDALVAKCQAHGGFVSYKNNSDGSQSPYEMNIVYFDAINNPSISEPSPTQVARFMVSQAIMLALAGVPGIYVHSLFGSRNDRAAAIQSGIHRRINRRKFVEDEMEVQLQDQTALPTLILSAYSRLLRMRQSHPAFNPHAAQRVFSLDPGVFALMRSAPENRHVLCLHNVTGNSLTIQLPDEISERSWGKIFSESLYSIPNGEVILTSYEILWLQSVAT